MPRLKAFSTTLLIIVFTLLMVGCDLLPFLNSGPELADTGTEGDLPEWLMLAYRSTESAVDDELVNPKDRNGQDEPEGDSDEEEEVIPPSATQDYTPAPAPSGGTTPPPSNNNQGGGGSDMPEPGTMAYILWKKRQEEAARKEREKERAEEDAGSWWDTGS